MNVSFMRNSDNQRLAHALGVNCLEETFCFPKYFEIETVNICNARCAMCTINSWEKRKNVFIDEALFSKFIEEATPHTSWIETVSLNKDGEPTLDKKLVSRVRRLKDIGIKKVTFATNGQLLDSELARQLIDVGLDDIMVSIDAVTRETFKVIRIGLDYDVVLKNAVELIRIRNEKRSKMTIRIRMVIMKENRHELEDWLRFWKSKIGKYDKVYAKPMHTWGNQLGEEASEMVSKYADKPCVTPFSSMVIKVDGCVPLCAVDYNVRYLMGDFSNQSIKEIWTGDHFSRLRSQHCNKERNKIDMCRGCHIWEEELLVVEEKKI